MAKKLERTFLTRYLFDFQIVITLKLLKQTQLFYIKIGKACILENNAYICRKFQKRDIEE